MNYLSLYFSLLTLLSVLWYKLINRPIMDLTDINKCPYCYGTNLCSDFISEGITLKNDTFGDLFTNYISTKNVFYAFYNDDIVVLKKLAHNSELGEFDARVCADNGLSESCDVTQIIDFQDYKEKIQSLLQNADRANETNNFRLCSGGAIEKFLEYFETDPSSKEINLWTTLSVNVEPLVMQILDNRNHWPVPLYHGACGRVIVESYHRTRLNLFDNSDWHIRAKLALLLMQAAKNFTERHPDFRFYLTDISPDNIAVDIVDFDLTVMFVDLENVIITDNSLPLGSNVHHSYDANFQDGFAFSENSICASSISDHNYYAICKLLLSHNSPWPMMQGGLLHSAPYHIKEMHSDLFTLIEECVNPTGDLDRFEISEKIIQILLNFL